MAKAKQKFYAIKKGVDPKTGKPIRNKIYQNWAEAETYIKGVNGAEYKSFGTWEEAEQYLKGNTVPTKGKTKGKFYAIKSGQDPKTKTSVSGLILTTWEEAKLYVTGVAGVEYKSFTSEDDAKAYLQGESGSVSSSLEMLPDVLYAYVDGSFNENIPNYSFGLCCVLDSKVIHMDKGLGNNPSAIEMRQVGGELLGAINTLLYAKKNGYQKVVILHDYLGVANHATGVWKRDSEYSKIYYEWMQKFFSSNPGIKVNFVKVDAHTGNDYNEIADGLAKIAVGIEPNPIFYRMVKKHNLDI